MKKRLLACLLTLCLTIGLFAVLGISAAAADPVAELVADDVTISYLSFADAVNAAKLEQNCTVRLLADTTADAVSLDGDYTLDLNGKTLTVASALTLDAGLLTVTDGSNAKNGKTTPST